MKSKHNYQVLLGHSAPPLTQQLKGYLHARTLKHFDVLSRDISRLRVHGILSDSAATAARKKLLRQIQSAITELDRELAANR